jgi:hypothetical protein
MMAAVFVCSKWPVERAAFRSEMRSAGLIAPAWKCDGDAAEASYERSCSHLLFCGEME